MAGVSERATYVSVFDDVIVCRSACRFDPEAKLVFDIEPAENGDEAEFADARTDEYVIVDGVERRAEDDVSFDY